MDFSKLANEQVSEMRRKRHACFSAIAEENIDNTRTFQKINFDDIVKALQNTHQKDESIYDLASYKEAFDTLCNTLPLSED